MLPLRTLGRGRVALESHRHWFTTFLTRAKHTNATANQPKIRKTSHGNRQTKGSKAQFIRKTESPSQELSSEDAAIIRLSAALKEDDIATVSGCLRNILDTHKSLAQGNDFRNIAIKLYDQARFENSVAERERRHADHGVLIKLADDLVAAIMNGSTKPNALTNRKLLVFFNEAGDRERGTRFWDWLHSQGEPHLDRSVYGTAIEMLAAEGKPLHDLEALYEEALQRFPGDFLSYHMSPEAIVVNRDQATPVRGVSNVLLNGIITARLYNAHTRDAYMALDTMIRLHPALAPAPCFVLFDKERPPAEAYTVLAMAMRAGIKVPIGNVEKMIQTLIKRPRHTSVAARVLSIRQALSLVYMHYGSGGTLRNRVINNMITSVARLMQLDGVSSLEDSELQRLVNGISPVISKLMEKLAIFGHLPNNVAFGAIISNLGGIGRSKSIIDAALKDSEALGITLNANSKRAVLISAGLLRDEELVRSSWTDLVQDRVDVDELPSDADIHALIHSAKQTGCLEFAEQVAEHAIETYLPEETHEGIRAHITAKEDAPANDQPPADVTAILTELNKFDADLDFISTRKDSPGGLQDFGDVALPTTLELPSAELMLPESELRKFYDELTTEQTPSNTPIEDNAEQPTAQAEGDDASTPATASLPQVEYSSTNIRFGELRYENWKSINYLLALAEKNDDAYHGYVEQAIADGGAMPRRQQSIVYEQDPISFGLSDYAAVCAQHEPTMDEFQIQKARAEILRLRGRLPVTNDAGSSVD